MEQIHIPILKCFDELKFNLGKRTLADFLKGDTNPSIERNKLEELESYGCLFKMDKMDIIRAIDILIKNKYLETQTILGGFQVIKRTSEGTKEIYEKKFTLNISENINNKNLSQKYKQKFTETQITENDKKLFTAFDFFLGKYNEEQKKAIIEDNKTILCIAGAGSGKTTVLTKRIEFLTKFRSVKEKDILAITFTKKAKEEMESRLKENGILNTKIETFNSFCEKILKKYGEKLYNKDNVKVAEFRDKISIVNNSLKKTGVGFETFYDEYFNKRQIREKTKDELFFIFVNDIFTIIDYYKNYIQEIKPFYENEKHLSKKRVAKLIFEIAQNTEKEMKKKALRDFSDQINDTLELFEKFPEVIPKYNHILIDEFQDVNYAQYQLIKKLSPENIFAVGDPRQAIYGWRGSEIKYILDFPNDFENTSVIQLKKNYRSDKNIVDICNEIIKPLGLTNLEANENEKSVNDTPSVYLIEQDNEMLEKRFILEAIKNSKNKKCEIFVLARTNRILENYSDFFRQNNLNHTIKSEEEYKNREPKEDEVVLATVHSIKGMEANEVYVISANTLSFPNKVQDNFVFALMKQDDEYDKDEEELRLFYVALSRAKSKLVITYTGNQTKFITSDVLKHLNIKEKNKKLFDFPQKETNKMLSTSNNSVLKNMLKDWRSAKSNETGLPTYMILGNETIEELTKQKPSTKPELHNIKGLGEMKIAKYGDEILKIIGN